MPEEIGQLTSLENLDLRFNRLTSLPTSIGDLINLKFLNINLNRLASLPESIGQLTNLKGLSLPGNYILPWPTKIYQQLLNKTPRTQIYGSKAQGIPVKKTIQYLQRKTRRIRGYQQIGHLEHEHQL